LGNSAVAERLTASQEELNSMELDGIEYLGNFQALTIKMVLHSSSKTMELSVLKPS
jgi:hypothetical protein